MKEKRFRSVVRRVVFLPMLVMGLFIVISLAACFWVFVTVERQIMDSNLNAVQISQNQLEYQMKQIDQSFSEYSGDSIVNRTLCEVDKNLPRSKYILYEIEAQNWISTNVSLHQDMQGAMLYYENIDRFMFRGVSNTEMHRYLRNRIKKSDGIYNSWEVISVEQKSYLIKVYRYGRLYAAAWFDVSDLENHLKLKDNDAYLGEVYFIDDQRNNTIADEDLNQSIRLNTIQEQEIEVERQTYINRQTNSSKHMINMGIIILKKKMFSMLPIGIYLVFGSLMITIISVPMIISWLQKKIARPIKEIDDAMKMIGEGHMDYRIDFTPKSEKVYDEIDRLIARFNEMMDELNELEFNLYESKLKEQQTELKFISQQIRPHFILNALNIIYTYDISEFDLVKKMVLHLTDYFRYIVNLKVDFLDLEQEMYHVKNYLYIQKERYMDGFESIVEWEIETANIQIPPLIIQTFVENSIKYALRGRTKLFIYVLASIVDGRLKLMIADTGNGYSEDTLKRLNTFLETREHQDGLGVGIENAIERLDILYEESVEVIFRNALSKGAVVEIYLPIIKKENTEEETEI